MLYLCASGDLIRPAHNKPYRRSALGQTNIAVPLGCGQLRSGVDVGRGASDAHWATPSSGLGVPRSCRRAGLVRGIERLPFGDDRPRQMQQLAGGGTAGHLRRLPGRAQALVVRFDHWIKACGRQGRQIQRRPQSTVATVTNLRPRTLLPDSCASGTRPT